MAHGKTNLMRNIRRPGPTWVHRHVGVPRWVRRNRKLAGEWKGALVENEPYTTSERDRRKGRKLRSSK